jgi:hypothetical protein
MSLSSHCFFPIKISHSITIDITVDDPKAARRITMSSARSTGQQAFRRGKDFSVAGTNMSAFELWDSIGADPMPVIQQLSSEGVQVADREKWMLVKGGPGVLPEVHKLLGDEYAHAPRPAIKIGAWLEAVASLDVWKAIATTKAAKSARVTWAIAKVESLHAGI